MYIYRDNIFIYIHLYMQVLLYPFEHCFLKPLHVFTPFFWKPELQLIFDECT